MGEGRESDVVVVAVFKLFSFMRLWLILVAKQPLKERRQRREREKARERGGERERDTIKFYVPWSSSQS